jgi:vancomycin resistance protein YoaR
MLLAWSALGLGVARVPGVRLAGEPPPATPAGLRKRAELWRQQSLTLHVGYHVFQPARAELGYTLQVEDAQRELRRLGRSPNPLVSLHQLLSGWFGAGLDVAWRPRVLRPEALDRYLERVRGQVERLPLAGSYAPDGTEIAGLPGEAFDTVVARRAIEGALLRGDSELTIATIVTPALGEHRRFADPARAASTLLSSQETFYRPQSGRAQNIELAARLLDGAVLQPGAALSFNASVGKRELARGFAPALELVNGELAQGVGGGVCQVAGTLHAAAFYAGLKVEEYHAHSRLSRLAYLPPGLDAMVAWPESARALEDTKDMRIRNPYPFPVRVAITVQHAGRQNSVRVQLFGAAAPFPVKFRFQELQRTAAPVEYRDDPTLPAGEQRVQQAGLDGLSIARHRTIFTPLGATEELTRVAYPPTPRIVLVGRRR